MMDKRQQCLILLAMLTDLCGGKIVHCQPESFAEVGLPFKLPCGAPGSNYDIYWYKGNDTSTVPLLFRENGQLGGTKYGKGDLELTTDGSIRIINIKIRHEGSYTLLAFSETFERYTVTTQLTVYVPPESRCVEVDSCPSTCSDCYLDVTGSGDLTCHVRGSRPPVGLDWIVTNQSGISFVKDQQETKHDEVSGTYNTTRTIHYTVDHCGGTATIHCNSSLSQRSFSSILDVNKHSIQISSETCTPPISLDRKWMLPVTVITVFTVLVVVVALILYIIVRRQRQSSTDKKDSQSSQEEMQTLRSPLVKDSQKSEKATISRLLPYLEERYKQMNHVKPVPWGEDIPIESMYIDTLCEVSDEKRKCNDNLSIFIQRLYPSHAYPSEKDADDLLMRTLVVGDLGYGKTTLLQYLTSQWAKKSRKEQEKEIMFLIPLKDLKSHDSVADAICRTLPSDLDISETDLINLFKRRRCLLLLDGLDEIHKSDGQCDLVNVDENSLTIDSILNNTPKRGLSNLRICVTSRNVENADMFSRPYTMVTLLPLTDQHVEAYIEKTIAYNWDIYSNCPNKEQKYTYERQLAKAVKDVLDSHDLIVDFKKSPYLMMMFIHIVLHKLMNIRDDDCLTEIDLGKLSSLVATITVCLERRYKQKFQQTAFATLKENLGKISLKPSTGNFITYWNFSDIEKLLGSEIDTALAVGYIKRSTLKENDKVSHIPDLSSTTFPGVVFIHDFIQEYCIAWYISKHKHEEISTFIDTVKGASEKSMRHRRVLQFVSAIDPSLSSKVLDGLTDKRCWDTVIDFLYEYRNDNEVKALQKSQLRIIEVMQAKQSDKPRMFVKNLHRKYHRDAFEFFCKTCRESNIKLESLTFTSDCTIEYLLQLELPFVESITLREMNLTDEYFKDVLVWTCVKTKISSLIFSKSIIPEKVDVETLLQDKERKLKKIQNIVSSSGGGHESKELNWKDGTWTWKSFINPGIKV